MNGIRENEELSFSKLYEKYHSLIYGVCFSILKNKEDAEDVMQNVFSKVHEISKDKLPEKHEASWLYKVARNETISYLRRKEKFEDLEDIYEIESTDSSIEEAIDKFEYKRLIEPLSQKEKEIISLKILTDLSFREIGKLLGEPASTIKWRYYKAIHSLKLLIGNMALSVVSFVIGIRAMFTQKNKAENEQTKQEQEIDNTTLDDRQDVHREENTLKDTQKVEISNTTSSETKTETTMPEDEKNISDSQSIQTLVKDGNLGYVQVCAFTISFVFLFFAICFLVSFVKYKVKMHKNK